MIIDKDKIYTYGKYSYVNFTRLSREELLQVLEWRNHPDVRKYLNNPNPIHYIDHLNFCGKLAEVTDKYYWVVKKGNRSIGVLNIIDVNQEENTCESGFYLIPDLVGSGEGLFAMCNYKSFLLSVLNFKAVYGHNFSENQSALMITMFFGAIINNVQQVNGKLQVETLITKESLQNGEGTPHLLLNFAKFSKEWNMEHIIKQFGNNGK